MHLAHRLAWLSALAAAVAAVAANLVMGDEPLSVRLLLTLPLAFGAAAALLRRSAAFAGALVLLLGWSLISLASVGIFYLPAAALMAAAALTARSARSGAPVGGGATTRPL